MTSVSERERQARLHIVVTLRTLAARIPTLKGRGLPTPTA